MQLSMLVYTCTCKRTHALKLRAYILKYTLVAYSNKLFFKQLFLVGRKMYNEEQFIVSEFPNKCTIIGVKKICAKMNYVS